MRVFGNSRLLPCNIRVRLRLVQVRVEIPDVGEDFGSLLRGLSEFKARSKFFIALEWSPKFL
jgi:hypothetical protein